MMKGDIQIGRVRIKLFDLDKGSTAEILSDYSGNVRDLMRQYNKAAYSELQKIGDELKQKLKLEIGVYINGKNKVATKKFHQSIYSRVTQDNNNVIFNVVDTGLGIDPECKEMIFDEFYSQPVVSG